MGIGVSLILIAVGAILTWAVNATVSGLDINTIGIILMVVGAVGLVLSLMFWSSWGGVGGARRRTTYVPPPGYYARQRTTEWEWGAGWPPSLRYAEGSSRLNVEPWPRPADSTQIRPSMRRTSSRQMKRPRPVPPTPRVMLGSRR